MYCNKNGLYRAYDIDQTLDGIVSAVHTFEKVEAFRCLIITIHMSTCNLGYSQLENINVLVDLKLHVHVRCSVEFCSSCSISRAFIHDTSCESHGNLSNCITPL